MRDSLLAKVGMALVEALSRASRDYADVAAMEKELRSLGLPVFTLRDGASSALHVGFKRTSAHLLPDLREKPSARSTDGS